MEIYTSPNLQSYVINNSRKGDEDEYKCQILPSSGFVNGPTITLTLKESYSKLICWFKFKFLFYRATIYIARPQVCTGEY